MDLEALFDRSVGIARMRQARVAARVGDGKWWVDPQNGVARLHDAQRRPKEPPIEIQILGSEAVQEGRWRWEWANPLNLAPPSALALAERMRALGAREGIAELTERTVPLDGAANADVFGTLAIGVLDAPGYFVHEVRDVLRVACVLDESWRTPLSPDLEDVARTIGELASKGTYFVIERAVEGLLDALDIPREKRADVLVGKGPDGRELRVTLGGARFQVDVTRG